MRLFPNQISALQEVFEQVISHHQVLDRVLKFFVDKNKRWGSRDRKNFYQAAYDIVRHYELLDYIKKDKYADVVSAYLNEMAKLSSDFEALEEEYPDLPFSIRYSIPSSTLAIFQQEDTHAEENLKAMHRIGDIYLRVNTSLISFDEFLKKLDAQEIAYKPIKEFLLESGKKVALSCVQIMDRTQRQREFFEKNNAYFEIQDIGSQIITALLPLEDSKIIIESCAGNGGKTAQIQDLVYKDKSLILSFDKERKKIEHLIERMSKWKEHKVVAALAKEKEVMKYEGMADILYLDVPCTGSGTLKRQADLKYRIDMKTLEEKTAIQREIFHLFTPTLKKEAYLAYSTCSLFQSENEGQVAYFQKNGFELIEQYRLEPRNYTGDGFFFALLRKI